MNVAKRTQKLKALLDLRVGPGAAILPNDVKRLHLDFARKFNGGHLGARKVWRQYLPRLKYHNPAISMTVERTDDQEAPAILSIYFEPAPKPSSHVASATPSKLSNPSTAPSLSTNVVTIDMKYKSGSEILSRLLELTKAWPYEATAEELVELGEVEEYNRRSMRDRAAQAKLNQTRRQEQALLDLARGAGKQTTAL